MGNGDQVAGQAVRGSVRVSSRSGSIEVIAEGRDDVVAEKNGETVALDDTPEGASIASRHSPLVVKVPEGSDVVLGTVSGDVRCIGRLGRVAVNTISARIEIDRAAAVDARSMSGRVKVGSCDGEFRCDVVSGRAEVETAGAVLLSTTSGRITARSVQGKARARTVSGRIRVAVAVSPVDVKVECVSGRIQVRVPTGSRPRTRLTTKRGKVRSSLAEGEEGFVSARTLSGSILIDEAPG